MAELAGSGASLADFIWKNAEDLWGDFKHTDFGKIILPFTLLRRLECVLEPTREGVRETHAAFKDAETLARARNSQNSLLAQSGDWEGLARPCAIRASPICCASARATRWCRPGRPRAPSSFSARPRSPTPSSIRICRPCSVPRSMPKARCAADRAGMPPITAGYRRELPAPSAAVAAAATISAVYSPGREISPCWKHGVWFAIR